MKEIRTSALLYIVFGLIMLLFPDFISESFGYVVGSMSLILGITQLIIFNKSIVFSRSSNLIIGIIGIAFGIYLFLDPKFVSAIIPVIVGIVIILVGISKISFVVDANTLSTKYGKISIAVSILLMILGCVFIFYPFESTKVLICMVGSILIVNGVYDIVISYQISNALSKPVKKRNKKVVKTIDAK